MHAGRKTVSTKFMVAAFCIAMAVALREVVCAAPDAVCRLQNGRSGPLANPWKQMHVAPSFGWLMFRTCVWMGRQREEGRKTVSKRERGLCVCVCACVRVCVCIYIISYHITRIYVYFVCKLSTQEAEHTTQTHARN